jgi:hypothetical protein
LNTATEKELEDLPGIGPAYAKRVIAGRPYSSVADLSKAGVPAGTIDKIRGMATVKKAPAATRAAEATTEPASGRKRSTDADTAGHVSPSVTARAATATEQPPARGMVWVNLETKVYHREGDRFYGKTKQGKYMAEADAIKAGYRLSKEKGEPKS